MITRRLVCSFEPRCEKTAFCICKNKDADQLRGNPEADHAFVFATQIGQYLYFLNPKFHASSHLLWLYSLVCVRPGLKPECWFSHDATHIMSQFGFISLQV